MLALIHSRGLTFIEGRLYAHQLGLCQQDVGSHDISYERWVQLNVWINVRKHG